MGMFTETLVREQIMKTNQLLAILIAEQRKTNELLQRLQPVPAIPTPAATDQQT